jgi:hypothetical protein
LLAHHHGIMQRARVGVEPAEETLRGVFALCPDARQPLVRFDYHVLVGTGVQSAWPMVKAVKSAARLARLGFLPCILR